MITEFTNTGTDLLDNIIENQKSFSGNPVGKVSIMSGKSPIISFMVDRQATQDVVFSDEAFDDLKNQYKGFESDDVKVVSTTDMDNGNLLVSMIVKNQDMLENIRKEIPVSISFGNTTLGYYERESKR